MGGGSLLRSPVRPILRPNRIHRFSNSSSNASSSSSGSAPVFVAGVRSRTGRDEPGLSVFGSVPSEEEAEAALSALKQVFIQFPREETPPPLTGIPNPSKTGIPIPSITGNANPSETSTELGFSPSNSNSTGLNRIHNSLDLLHRTPSIQKLVLSLSTDKAVWDAIMKNEAVKELHNCFLQAGKNEPLAFLGQDSFVPSILKWVIENAKTKIIELIDQITDLMGALFKAKGSEETMSILNDVMKSSFMLTVMVLLVVIVSRLQIDAQ